MFSSFDHRSQPFDYVVFRRAVIASLLFTGVLWFILMIEWVIDIPLTELGIYPRTLSGSVGIFLSPLIHADAVHLLSNTFPAVVLVGMLFYFYNNIAREVFIWIYLCTGIWVWAFAREAYHIGSSGVIYGLAAFLLTSGFKSRNIQLIAVSLIVIFLYGGMFYGILPNGVDPEVSWESHLMGALAGVLFAFIFVKKPRKQEDEDDMPDTHQDQMTSTSDQSVYFKYVYKENRGKSESGKGQ